MRDGEVFVVEFEDARRTSKNFYVLLGHVFHLCRESVSDSACVFVKNIDVGNGVSVYVPLGSRGPGQSR